MKILLFDLILITLYSVFESLHDINVIKNDKGYNKYSKRWHILSGIITGFVLVIVPIAITCNNFPLVLILGIVNIFWFWQLHDSIIGYGLTKNIFYLGNTGTDAWLNRVFYGGKTLTAIRLLFIGCAILEYFRNI
jgi:hypothetical protein